MRRRPPDLGLGVQLVAISPCVGDPPVCAVCGKPQHGYYGGKKLCEVHYLKARMDSQWELIKQLQDRAQELERELGARDAEA